MNTGPCGDIVPKKIIEIKRDKNRKKTGHAMQEGATKAGVSRNRRISDRDNVVKRGDRRRPEGTAHHGSGV